MQARQARRSTVSSVPGLIRTRTGTSSHNSCSSSIDNPRSSERAAGYASKRTNGSGSWSLYWNFDQYVSVYSPWELTAAELDGVATGMEPADELGWRVYSRYVDIPPGGEVVLRLRFEGEMPPGDGYVLTVRSQPLTNPDVVRVDVRTDDGRSLVRSYDTPFGVDRLVAAH